MFPVLLSVDDTITSDILHLELVGTWGGGSTYEPEMKFIHL